MIEKIEDELSRAAKSDGKNKERRLLGNQGTPPSAICMSIKRKKLLEKQSA